MDCSTPGFPVHHQLSELAQTFVHRVGDAVQPSHPLSSLSPASVFLSIKVFPMSQFFASGGPSIGVSALASFLPKKSLIFIGRTDDEAEAPILWLPDAKN